MYSEKKSQVTIFLVLGAVIVVMAAILMVINRYSVKETSKHEIIDAKEIVFDIQPIKNFVSECLSIVSKDVLKKHFNENSTEEQLGMFVKKDIDECLDFFTFEQQGFYISMGEKIINTSINKNDVIFRMTYPIIITDPVNGEKTEIKDFLARHEIIQEEI